MRRAGVSESGVELMTPKLGFHVFHLRELPHAMATILKQEALAAGAEAAVHRGLVVRAVDATDVVLGGTRRQLERIAQKLRGQQFGLGALADELTGILAALDGVPVWHVRDRVLDLTRPLVMGVVNLTGDSFSGDGVGDDVGAALERCRAMLAAGADILDLGAESSRPGALPVDVETETRRLVPVVRVLVAETDAVVSVDTYRPETAAQALEAGAHIVNDVTGMRGLGGSGGTGRAVALFDAGVIIMHMRGTPRDMQRDPHYDDLGAEIHAFFAERLEAAAADGVRLESIALDPGIGFGKRLEDNLALLNHLEWFAGFGRPLVVGASRKSFIGALTGAEVGDRLSGTIAAHTAAILRGARVVRVHDVAEARQAALVAAAVSGAGQ
ncbi:MAG: dihydropteroate synthase [Candidatus Coatesbacteria bacterium RBG_13_66_14]|uniref:dihydropteroate synthase n=1 Tax=Candidatus Coatesbacteria bacterium RBG_13_66_14 TaxID=1817816 RepID=A0A1F5EYQ6_9BACT|nr:MAG: dihydropteroate synthase [Candidatus Coatesbacteria bacterium RBG_13_66_14]